MVCFDVRYRIERDGRFWFVECKDYPVFTQGNTKQKAVENLREAFLLYAEDSDAQMLHPELKQLFTKERFVEAPVSFISLAESKLDSFFEATYDPLADHLRRRTNKSPV